MKLDQEQVNNIVKAMAMAGLEHHMELAKLAVEETGRGIYEDKITKNMFATEYIYHSIKYDKTVGVINENEEEGYEEIAEPIGIIAGVTPVTNCRDSKRCSYKSRSTRKLYFMDRRAIYFSYKHTYASPRD